MCHNITQKAAAARGVWHESTIATVEAAVTAAEVQLREARRTAIQAGQAKMALMQQLVTLAKQLSTVQVITATLTSYSTMQWLLLTVCCLVTNALSGADAV
jgi:predicted kinase